MSSMKDRVFGMKVGETSQEDSTPKRFKMCYVDADTFLVRAAKLMQEDYIEVLHKASGRKIEFRNKTSFGIRSDKIIVLTDGDIQENKREVTQDVGGKSITEPYKWLAWKNHDQQEKGATQFSVDDFEITPKARLSSEFDSFEKALETAEMVFASNVKGVKTNMESEDYTLCISSGNGNYRNYESKTIGYKSSRLEKPIYFQEMKDAIASMYKNKIWWTDENEAEDYIQYIAKQQEALYGEDQSLWDSCGTYLDKDVDQVYIPRKNFDKYEKGWLEHDKLFCEKTLVAQTIAGDMSTDTIEGLPTLSTKVREVFGIRKGNGVSKATAEKLLDTAETIQEMWKRAVYSYQQYYGYDDEYQFKDVHGEDQCWTWIDYMQQCYSLVKMQEYKGQIPCVRKYMDSIGVDWQTEISYGEVEIDTESLVESLEVCKNTLSEIKENNKSYKSLKKGELVDKMDLNVKLISELEGNFSLLEK